MYVFINTLVIDIHKEKYIGQSSHEMLPLKNKQVILLCVLPLP